MIILQYGWSVEGTATVELSVQEYSNPSNRLYSGDCCRPSIACNLTCNPVYIVCFNSTYDNYPCTPWSVKKRATILLSISLPNIDHFSKLFHRYTLRTIYDKTVVKDFHHTRNASLHYLVKYKFSKLAATEAGRRQTKRT